MPVVNIRALLSGSKETSNVTVHKKYTCTRISEMDVAKRNTMGLEVLLIWLIINVNAYQKKQQFEHAEQELKRAKPNYRFCWPRFPNKS